MGSHHTPCHAHRQLYCTLTKAGQAVRQEFSEGDYWVSDTVKWSGSILPYSTRDGISQGVYYKWSKDFMEAGKKRPAASQTLIASGGNTINHDLVDLIGDRLLSDLN